jgi:hypothetical protein
MLQWLYTYVASVCSQCFIYVFRRTLQVCLSGCCICFTHMLQACKCFILMFRMFAMIFKCISGVFFKCFQKHVSSVSSIVERMLQVLYLDVSKVDRVLHIGCT